MQGLSTKGQGGGGVKTQAVPQCFRALLNPLTVTLTRADLVASTSASVLARVIARRAQPIVALDFHFWRLKHVNGASCVHSPCVHSPCSPRQRQLHLQASKPCNPPA